VNESQELGPLVVVDYDMGNVGSIVNMLRKLGHASLVSHAAADIRAARAVIISGVGAFDEAMRNLARLDLKGPLHDAVIGQGTPVLGICLGMQLLGDGSEEGSLEGLGWIAGYSRRFSVTDRPVPHMGWTPTRPRPVVDPASPAARLFSETPDDQRYYYVHSYHVCCERPEDVLATAEYGYEFTAAVGRSHIMGTQFHPEKSHQFGMRVLRNFVAISNGEPA